jgi:hypothetical protein
VVAAAEAVATLRSLLTLGSSDPRKDQDHKHTGDKADDIAAGWKQLLQGRIVDAVTGMVPALQVTKILYFCVEVVSVLCF